MKIAIVTDSLTNLTKEDLTRYPFVHYAYLNVIINDKSYVDIKEINNEKLFSFIDQGAKCSTSQPSPEAFVNLYEELLTSYDHVLSLHCTGNVSGTVNSARIASEMLEGFEGKISVIDTNTAAIGVENIVLKACELIEAGKSLDEVLKTIEFYRHNTTLCLSIDDLSTLVRSGRLSKKSAMIGNLLNIKPIVGFVDAKLDVLDKVRTKKRVVKWLTDSLAAEVEKSGKQVVRITHVNALATAQELKEMMESKCGDMVRVYVGNEIGPVMAIHFGRGGFGASWMSEEATV